MKSSFAKFLVAFLLPVSAFAAHGGSVGGGGADSHADAAAWFTDPSPNKIVHACVQVDSNFGVDKASLQRLSGWAFEQWVNYYRKTGAADRSSEGCAIDGHPGDRKNYHIALNISFQDACDGSEDLTLSFGVSNADLEARRNHYNFPYAFAELLDAFQPNEHQKAWSKGIVYVSPGFAWSNYQDFPLAMTLLHEFGHVFGTGHIDDTVMDSDIGKLILPMVRKSLTNTKWSDQNPLYLSIDKSVYLVLPPEQAIDLPMVPVPKGFQTDDSFQRNIIQSSYSALTGMNLQDGNFEAVFNKPTGAPRDASMRNVWELGLFSSTITIRADGLESKLTFVPTSFVAPQDQDGIAFNEGCIKQTHMSGSIAGRLVRPDGSSKQVILDVNTPGRVKIMDDPYNPSAFCTIYSRLGEPCTLLSADYSKIAESLNLQMP